jgi:hypothetical protein
MAFSNLVGEILMRRSIAMLSCLLLLLASCRSATPIDIRKDNDLSLDCNGLYQEILAAEKAEQEAREIQGDGMRNVMAFAMWGVPGSIIQNNRNSAAIDAARDRKANLQRLADKKNCPF